MKNNAAFFVTITGIWIADVYAGTDDLSLSIGITTVFVVLGLIGEY